MQDTKQNNIIIRDLPCLYNAAIILYKKEFSSDVTIWAPTKPEPI